VLTDASKRAVVRRWAGSDQPVWALALAHLDGDASPLGRAHSGLADAALVEREHFALFVGVGRGELLPYGSCYLNGLLNERPHFLRAVGAAPAAAAATTMLPSDAMAYDPGKDETRARYRGTEHVKAYYRTNGYETLKK
jgi:TorA maturation chaperone TorD